MTPWGPWHWDGPSELSWVGLRKPRLTAPDPSFPIGCLGRRWLGRQGRERSLVERHTLKRAGSWRRPVVSIRIPCSSRGWKVRETCYIAGLEDVEGTMSQGMQATSRRWEEQGKELSFRASRRKQSYWHLGFSPVRVILNFRSPQPWGSRICYFKQLSLWSFVRTAWETRTPPSEASVYATF